MEQFVQLDLNVNQFLCLEEILTPQMIQIYMGLNRKVATGYSFADITATFQCSSDMKEKKYFRGMAKTCI